MAGPERLLEPILSIHERIRAAAVDACARIVVEGGRLLAGLAAEALVASRRCEGRAAIPSAPSRSGSSKDRAARGPGRWRGGSHGRASRPGVLWPAAAPAHGFGEKC